MSSTDLRSDCSRCFALCCVLLPYSADAGFGADKAGGTPCSNLAADDQCRIHTDLRETGWRGCTIFECFGAGQQVSQVTYEGRSWRDPSVNLGEMAAAFSALRLVHEMLFHLEEAQQRCPSPSLDELASRLQDLRMSTPEEILAVDLDDLIEEVGAALRGVSAVIRGPEDRDHRRALLMAADLRGADLGQADLLGADLRDAQLQGADLSQVLFLTQPQLNAADGDETTRIPPRLQNPWRVISTP